MQDQENLSVDYVLVITGGAGAGIFSPLIDADGVLNESSFPNLWPQLGGSALVNSPVSLAAGDPDPGSHPNPAQAFCTPVDNCYLSFTYGVPIDLHFDVTVSAAIEADTDNATLGESVSPTTSSVEFQGVVAFDANGTQVPSNDVDLNLVPEPSTLPVLFGVLAVGIAYRRRHWIIEVCRFWLP